MQGAKVCAASRGQLVSTSANPSQVTQPFDGMYCEPKQKKDSPEAFQEERPQTALWLVLPARQDTRHEQSCHKTKRPDAHQSHDVSHFQQGHVTGVAAAPPVVLGDRLLRHLDGRRLAQR